VDADELTAVAKRAEASLTTDQKSIDAEKRALVVEQEELKGRLERLGAERATLVAAIDPHMLALFELVSRRRHGVAVAEARDGICTICHVRLRPQVFNTIRRNEEILQCDTCQRILYFVPQPVPDVTQSAGSENVHH